MLEVERNVDLDVRFPLSPPFCDEGLAILLLQFRSSSRGGTRFAAALLVERGLVRCYGVPARRVRSEAGGC